VAPHPFITSAPLREVLAPQPGERILEVGPGTGYYTLDVAEWVSCTASGFTTAGANRFLSAGHPDAHEDLPPQMGLQSSDDGGESSETVRCSARPTGIKPLDRSWARVERGSPWGGRPRPAQRLVLG
jgi:hypothetical protein